MRVSAGCLLFLSELAHRADLALLHPADIIVSLPLLVYCGPLGSPVSVFCFIAEEDR